MIPIVEDYLSELIEKKIQYLKANPNHVGKILGANPTKINKLASYIKSKPIRVVRGYPIDAAQLPAVVILLSNEEETQEGLGNYGDSIDIDIREYTEELEVDSLNRISTINKSLIEISKIIHNDTGLEVLDYSVVDFDLGLVDIYDGNVEPEDSVTITYTYRFVSEEQMSTLFEANYRLETWSENSDLTVELYHIVKWAMLSGRDSLVEEAGLFNQRVSGADFEPVPNYLPNFVYRRALNFWCQFSVSTPEEEVQYISNIVTNQSEYSGGFTGGDTDGR